MKIKPDALKIPDKVILGKRFHANQQIQCKHNKDGFEFSKVYKEYCRFIELKIVTGDADATELSPSPIVDSIWHLHILDTRRYGEMCSKFPFFIHHDPDGGIDKDARRIRYKATLLTYKARFGETPPRNLWPEDIYQDESLTKNQQHHEDQTPPLCGAKIQIRLPAGKLLTIRNKTTVDDLKQEINKLSGLPMKDIRLIYGGKVLDDHDYRSLQDGTTIHLVGPRLRGC